MMALRSAKTLFPKLATFNVYDGTYTFGERSLREALSGGK